MVGSTYTAYITQSDHFAVGSRSFSSAADVFVVFGNVAPRIVYADMEVSFGESHVERSETSGCGRRAQTRMSFRAVVRNLWTIRLDNAFCLPQMSYIRST